jgi:hypothetical protein
VRLTGAFTRQQKVLLERLATVARGLRVLDLEDVEGAPAVLAEPSLRVENQARDFQVFRRGLAHNGPVRSSSLGSLSVSSHFCSARKVEMSTPPAERTRRTSRSQVGPTCPCV